jgi:SPP1 family predicted phage head-tail adaptor
MNGMAYIVDIKRPSKNPSDGGREGQPETVVSHWPCAINSGSGHEVVVARQINPLVTHVVRGIHPGKKITAQEYLEIDGRRLNIDSVDESKGYGAMLSLVCIEQQ